MLSSLGSIINPLETLKTGYGGLGDDNGPITFLSNILLLISVAAGIFALVNLVLAGIQFISASSNSESVSQAWNKIYMSLIGLVIIAAANIIAAIIGWVLFKDWNAILNPQIYGPGAP